MMDENNIQRGQTAIWESLIPVLHSTAGFERLIDLTSDARLILIGEASHGTRGFTKLERRSRNGSSSRRDLPPWQSRRTGPTRTGSTGSSAALPSTARDEALGDFERFHIRGATCRFGISPNGSGSTTTHCVSD